MNHFIKRADDFLLLSTTVATLCMCTALGCGNNEDNTPPASDMSADVVRDVVRDLPQDAVMPTEACGQAQQDSPLEDWVEGQIGQWRVQVDPKTGAWRAGEMQGPGVCVMREGALVPTVREGLGRVITREGFGSFRFRLIDEQVKWRHPTGEVRVRVEQDQVSIEYVSVDGGEPMSMVFSAYDERSLRIEMPASSAEVTLGQWSATCEADEGFFGLGSQSFGMNLRGGTFPLWTQEQGIGKPEDGGNFPINNIPEAAHAPMGIWHSSQGYTALLTHDAWSLLDLCESDTSRVTLTSYKQMPGVVLVPGESPLERLEQATTYLGRPTEPAPWTFAPWNDAVGGPERLMQVAKALRDNDVPSSAIWAEDWIGGSQTSTGYRLSYAWEWDPSTYPDLRGDIRMLHAQGFAFLAYFNTFVPATTRMFTEGEAQDDLIKTAQGSTYTFLDPAFRRASLVDLTKPSARTWLNGYLVRAAQDLEVDGWMADFSEWLPTDSVLHDGTDPWIYHNRYPVSYQRANREAMQQVHQGAGEAAYDWAVFSRAGWASVLGGSPSQASVMWGADQDTDWDYDDGLPTILPIGANLGLSGVPFFGSDIAGYTSIYAPNTTKELFYRWSSVGAFHPVMRTHHGSDECGNWSFDRDPETLEHYKRYASIHTLLYPYFDLYQRQATSRGWPIIRHPFLYHAQPEMWSGKDYSFYLGEDLLVAPVLTQGSTSRQVTLASPASTWWPLLGDGPLDGPVEDLVEGLQRVKVQASPTEIPVFVRPGTALPLLGRVVQSFYSADAEGVETLRDVKDDWAFGLYFDGNGDVPVQRVDEDQISVEAQALTTSDGLDWTQATLNGQPLGACVDALVTNCLKGTQLQLSGQSMNVTIPWLVGGKQAIITVTSSKLVRVRLGVGGEVFGVWRQPTALTDLNPDVPPPCEVEEQ